MGWFFVVLFLSFAVACFWGVGAVAWWVAVVLLFFGFAWLAVAFLVVIVMLSLRSRW